MNFGPSGVENLESSYDPSVLAHDPLERSRLLEAAGQNISAVSPISDSSGTPTISVNARLALTNRLARKQEDSVVGILEDLKIAGLLIRQRALDAGDEKRPAARAIPAKVERHRDVIDVALVVEHRLFRTGAVLDRRS